LGEDNPVRAIDAFVDEARNQSCFTTLDVMLPHRTASLMEEKPRVSPTQWTTAVGSLTSHPAAFLIVILYGLFWFWFEPSTFDWHAIATLIVWTMTLFIQRADRRDTLAIHAKLDELLKATREARTELASIDEREPEAIEKIRDRERREAETG
jgi:low affinity Fe/Cu permease